MIQEMNKLAFDTIIEQLKERANSPRAKEKIQSLTPYLSEAELKKNLRDTTQARQLLDAIGTPPVPAMEAIEQQLNKVSRSELLLPEELEQIGNFLAAVKRMKDYLERGKQYQISLAYYSENLVPLKELCEEIERCIRAGKIDDYASGLLKDIRGKLLALEDKIKAKAESVMRANKSYMSESFVVNRNGRICLPVKKDYKSKVDGSVVDKSSTGATLFIEPAAIMKLREEMEGLALDEDNEERRILYTLMSLVSEQEEIIRENVETIVKLDFIFAKGKLSADMNAVEPTMNTERYLLLKEARHPLIDKDTCVPLQFEIGNGKRGIIITGPNTGGKTVAIKTVGLFSMMACAGLHLPCAEANVCMNNQILCDIGDGQNIEDNLSTFSSHISNVLNILKKVTKESLVIMDELGSGTDPAEGMGIAIAILEQLRVSGCLFLVTTHYPEVKTYAGRYDEILNARMAFDRENLKPLYAMEIGKAGDSCALYIARRLGMPSSMILTAAKEAYGEGTGQLLKELELSEESKEELVKEKVPSIQKMVQKTEKTILVTSFTRGDSVIVTPEKVIGIVVQPADEQGNVLVQIKKEKRMVSHKRLKLHVAASQLYPEDYDFSIIFDAVEVRKARHEMGRKYQKDMIITLEEGF